MYVDEIARTIEAKRFAEIGMHPDAWEALESLEPAGCVTEEEATIRILVCTGLQKWGMGGALVELITPGHTLEARKAARFLLALSNWQYEQPWPEMREVALRSLKAMATVWPEGKAAALASKARQGEWPFFTPGLVHL